MYKIGECLSVSNNKLIKKKSEKLILLNKIEIAISNKMFNFKKNLQSIKERQVMFELIGFLNLINFSKMPVKEIKKHLEKSQLLYM